MTGLGKNLFWVNYFRAQKLSTSHSIIIIIVVVVVVVVVIIIIIIIIIIYSIGCKIFLCFVTLYRIFSLWKSFLGILCLPS